MVMNRRAQFFLLAAVIISAVVISLGISANRATVSREPGNFYDYSYEVQRETGAVIDYEIYTFDGSPQADYLKDFVDDLAYDIRDKNPYANFLFLYGSTEDNEGITYKNHGAKSANVDGNDVEGGGALVFSSIYIASTHVDSSLPADDYSNAGEGKIEGDKLEPEDVVVVTVDGYDFEFPVSRHRRVIFIMQKDVKDESFIAAG